MNKNKISLKTIIIIVILVLVGVLGVLGVNTAKTYLSGASSDMAPQNVLAKPSEDGKSVVITWTSDKASMGIVEYGTTPASLLLRSLENEQKTNHSLTLSPLKVGTNYYFRIKVGEDVFDNNGIPYSFKTKTVAISPTVIPTVNLVPTATSASSSGGSCNRMTDYNKDGAVNSLDYVSCLKNKTGETKTETCVSGVDYNKDGVVNSLDRIKCLQ